MSNIIFGVRPVIEAIEAGNDNGLESMIKQIIEDYEEEDEE